MSKETQILSQEHEEQYLIHQGMLCPLCGLDTTEATNNVQVDSTIAWQNITCLSCGATWQDVYQLIGIDNLEKGA